MRALVTLGVWMGVAQGAWAAPPGEAPPLTATASSGVGAAAGKQKRVAVLPFELGKGLDEGLGKALAGALLGEVRKQRGDAVNLMAPDDVVQALPDALRGRLKRCAMATCKAQMAQAVNADRALGGSVTMVGSTVVLNLALLEASDGTQVAQWTGKAPENTVDKLLDQLPDAVRAIFPAPVATPAPAVAAAPVPTPAPPPVTAAALPAQQPVAMVLLPPEEPPVVALAPPPKSQSVVMAMQDSQGPNALSSAQQAKDAAAEEAGWNGKLIGAAFGVGVPLVLVAALGFVLGIASTAGGVSAYMGARNINAEVKAVPHKNNGSFPLSSLIALGQALERLSVVLVGVVVVALALGAVALLAAAGSFAGLLVAAAPKPPKKAPHESAAAPTSVSPPAESGAMGAPMSAPGGTP